MIRSDSALAPEIWLHHVLSSKSVAEGGVIRRKRRDIERYVGLDAFLDACRLRGFQVVENRGQIVVFCNQAPLRRLV